MSDNEFRDSTACSRAGGTPEIDSPRSRDATHASAAASLAKEAGEGIGCFFICIGLSVLLYICGMLAGCVQQPW